MIIKADDNYYFSSPSCKISVKEIWIQDTGFKYLYEVKAIYADRSIPLKTFRDKKHAQSFAKRLVELLNEEETK